MGTRATIRHILKNYEPHELEDALTEYVNGLHGDTYRRIAAVLIDDLGGEVTIPVEHLDQADNLEMYQETTDEAGPDLVVRIDTAQRPTNR